MGGEATNVSFDESLLRQYETAALKNASELLTEAELLLTNKHFARAYFLSVAAIEEVGKASIAFVGRGRKLKSPGVQRQVNLDLRDHSKKITAAFSSSLKNLSAKDLRANLPKITDYGIALKYGREPSMYTDVDKESSIRSPSEMVRPEAATDCLRLAKLCLRDTHAFQTNNHPAPFSMWQDRWYELGAKSSKVWQCEDFGEYLEHMMDQHPVDADYLPRAIVTYYERYFVKKVPFKK
jgi:AbiV family abortive infection protein